jgi:hypothetical protein
MSAFFTFGPSAEFGIFTCSDGFALGFGSAQNRTCIYRFAAMGTIHFSLFFSLAIQRASRWLLHWQKYVRLRLSKTNHALLPLPWPFSISTTLKFLFSFMAPPYTQRWVLSIIREEIDKTFFWLFWPTWHDF